MGNGYRKRFHADNNGKPFCGECPPVIGLPVTAFLAHPAEHRCKKCSRAIDRRTTSPQPAESK